MADFSRKVAPKTIKNLKTEPLFAKLRGSIDKGEVLMAIRGGYVSFYYKGGSLFKYDTAFKTHIKYGFVPKNENGYVSKELLAKREKRADFEDAYKQIKARCALYAGLEAAGVSELHKFSYAKEDPKARYVLLDTEIALDARKQGLEAEEAAEEAKSEEDRVLEIEAFSSPETAAIKTRTSDRIDLLLMDTVTGQLLFCEAKHFSNKELRSGAIEEQLERYREQIVKNRGDILTQYRDEYRKAVRDLLNIELPEPIDICDKCGLLIFGFDSAQRAITLPGIKERVEKAGYPVYAIGDMKGIKAETLFTELAN